MVEGNVVDLVVNHGAHQAQPVNRPIQFGDGGRDVLHGQGGKALEAVGMVHS